MIEKKKIKMHPEMKKRTSPGVLRLAKLFVNGADFCNISFVIFDA